MKTGIAGALAAASALLATPAFAETPVERGEYLVRGPMACGNCHTPMGPDGPVAGQELAGRLVQKTDAFEAIAPNITPAGKVGSWSDADIEMMITAGKRPDGTAMLPPMPYGNFAMMTPGDVRAVIAYLRTLPPLPDPQ